MSNPWDSDPNYAPAPAPAGQQAVVYGPGSDVSGDSATAGQYRTAKQLQALGALDTSAPMGSPHNPYAQAVGSQQDTAVPSGAYYLDANGVLAQAPAGGLNFHAAPKSATPDATQSTDVPVANAGGAPSGTPPSASAAPNATPWDSDPDYTPTPVQAAVAAAAPETAATKPAPSMDNMGDWLDYHFGPENITARVGVQGRALLKSIPFAEKGLAAIEALPSAISGGGSDALQAGYSANLTGMQNQDIADQARAPWLTQPAEMVGQIGQTVALPEASAATPIAGAIKGALVGSGLAGLNSLSQARGGPVQEAAALPLPMAEGAAGGGLFGGAMGARAGMPAPVAPPEAAIAPHVPAATLADYQATGVQPMAAVNGTPAQVRVGQALSGLPIVNKPILKVAGSNLGAFDQGIQNAAASLGSSQGPEQAGGALQQGALDAIAAMKAKSGQLYGALDPLTNSMEPVSTLNSQTATNKIMEPFSHTLPEFRANNPVLSRFHDALNRTQAPPTPTELPGFSDAHAIVYGDPMPADPGQSVMSFKELKALRSSLGRQIDQGGILNTAENANLRTLYKAMSNDMEDNARRIGGPEALANMKAANAHEANMHRVIDETLSQVVGKNSSGIMMPREQAYSKLVADAKVGGSADIEQLQQLKKALPSQAWNEVGASILHNLGRSDAGFSTAKFATEWEKITPSAKAELFPPETVKAMDSFSRVAGDMKRASHLYNHSNSAHQLAIFSALEAVGEVGQHLMHGNFPEAATALAVPIVTTAGGYATAKLLASPKFVETAMNAAKIKGPNSPQLIDSVFAKYGQNNPALKSDVDQFRAALARRLISNAPKTVIPNALSSLQPTASTPAQTMY